MKKKLIISAVIALALGCGSYRAEAYTTLQDAIIDSTLPDVERTYTLTDNEAYTTALGNMGGDNSTLSIDGAGYGITSSGLGGINAVNTGQTLHIKNIGSAEFTKDDNGFVKSATVTNSWSGFNTEKTIIVKGTANVEDSVFSNNGKGILSIASGATASLKNVVFANNTTVSTPDIRATLVDNAGTLSVDGVTFVGNNITEHTKKEVGGMIRNYGTVTQITNSDFNYNTITTGVTDNGMFGSMITNGTANTRNPGVEITLIKNVNFIGNVMTTTHNSARGILENDGHIGTIDSVVFQDNVMSSAHDVHGGEHGTAINNEDYASIDIITNCIFKNNRAYRQIADNYTEHTSAGAISNYNYIGEISNTLFENNSAEAISKLCGGGAMINIYDGPNAQIGKMENVQFINNHALSSNGQAYAGAINNHIPIGSISGLFKGNYAISDHSDTNSGAILNCSRVGIINADFIDNYLEGNLNNTYAGASGGALSNSKSTSGQIGSIQKIIGNFTNNHAENKTGSSGAIGGAINNTSGAKIIDGIVGNFTGNYAKAIGWVQGGAIANRQSSIGDITGNFEGNYVLSSGSYVNGGAIRNGYSGANSSIGNITGNFIGNYAKASGAYAYGGAIVNLDATIGNITGDFLNNYASTSGTFAYGGAIVNSNSKIGNIKGNFIGNYAESTGSGYAIAGAISNYKTIGDITGNFIGNYVTSNLDRAYAGAIFNQSGTIGSITGDFINNYAKSSGTYVFGGAIENYLGTIGDIQGDFVNNHIKTSGTYSRGGAVDNAGTIGNIHGSFTGNYAESDTSDYLALGGAVYTTKDLDFVADNEQHTFSGNYTKDYRGTKDNAIFVATTATSSPTLKFETKNGGSFVMKDSIDGGVVSSDFKTYSTDYQYNVNITGDNSGTFYMLNDMYNANVAFNNTTVNTVNNDIHVYDFNSFTVNGNSNFVPDVNLSNQTMDRITASSYGSHAGKLNVSDMNITSDTTAEKVEVYFAQPGLKDYVTSSKTEYLTPIYKYNIRYDNRNDAGYFVFSKGNDKSNSENFNPSILAAPIAAQFGGYLVMLNTYDEAFRKMDMYMLMTKEQRQALKLKNKIASADGKVLYDKALARQEKPEGWVRPYATFESVSLSNGPKVSNVAYGTLMGGESRMKDLGHGWDGILSAYIGYNGSHQTYNKNSIWQNGGTLGLVSMAYKGNFFTGLNVSAGASAGKASTMFGDDDFAMLMAGVASKTGYNWELAKGKFIIQPSWLMSYSFVNTFDYTNAAGVRISSDPLHAIQLQPELKFIGNLKNGWQPYASVAMVWNIMDKTKFRANNVSLPEMSVRPYVKYGVGVRKSWGERFVGYFQTYITNGGRNGVGLQTGLNWTIGKDDSEQTKTSKTEKRIIKKTK